MNTFHDATSVRNVNLLFLAAFLALLVGSFLVPATSLGWRVVINELVFIALPLACYLVMARTDLRDALRLRGVGWQTAGLSLLIGLGLWRFDVWIATAINGALDYTIPLPPEALNVTPWDNVAMIVGTIVLAPTVEEFLFRGVLQSTYERRGPVRAIAASTVLFMVIHQELSQSVALLPVAIALGYITWRTRSIIPAILIHLTNNAQAMAASLVTEGRVQRLAFGPSAPGALIGLGVAAGAFWLLIRRTSSDRPEPEPIASGWLARNWPIIPVVPIYLAIIGLGLLIGARPQALAFGQRVDLASAPWDEALHWRYEIRDPLDDLVGEAECSLVPESDAFVLDCSMKQSAYEADAPNGFFEEGEVSQRQMVRWNRDTLAIERADIEAVFSEGSNQVELSVLTEDGRLSVRVRGAADQEESFQRCYHLAGARDEAEVPSVEDPCQVGEVFLGGGGVSSPLLVGEWPWRFSALPFELAYSRGLTLLWPYRFAAGLDGRTPTKQDAFVGVRTAEQVTTPAGEFIVWRVTVGDEYTAWYAVESPHHLVAYSDDVVTWQLTDVE